MTFFFFFQILKFEVGVANSSSLKIMIQYVSLHTLSIFNFVKWANTKNMHRINVALYLLHLLSDSRRSTGRWSWPLWLDEEENTSRWTSHRHTPMLWWSIYSDFFSTFFTFVVQEKDALSYVAGFTVANDVSARDWQMKRNGKQWLLGKTFDSFCPLGPALVTTDSVKGKTLQKPDSMTERCQRHWVKKLQFW